VDDDDSDDSNERFGKIVCNISEIIKCHNSRWRHRDEGLGVRPKTPLHDDIPGYYVYRLLYMYRFISQVSQ
jgi:hypothetical protein